MASHWKQQYEHLRSVYSGEAATLNQEVVQSELASVISDEKMVTLVTELRHAQEELQEIRLEMVV